MVSKTFKINKRQFLLRKLSILQHKLRVVVRCYTVFNFVLDDEIKKFKFQKKYKINGLKMEDPDVHFGSYEIQEIEGSDDIILIITI